MFNEFKICIFIAVIMVLVISSGILIHPVRDSAPNMTFASRNNYAVIDASNPNDYQYISCFGTDALEDASFAGIYSMNENAGYKKKVKTDGDFVFTIFKRTSASDAFHPDFLCFVSYNGSNRNVTIYNTSQFVSATSNSVPTGGTYGSSEVSDCLLFIGYVDSNYNFVIQFDLLDRQAEAEYTEAVQRAAKNHNGKYPDVSSYALSTSTVSIAID